MNFHLDTARIASAQDLAARLVKDGKEDRAIELLQVLNHYRKAPERIARLAQDEDDALDRAIWYAREQA